VTAPAGEGQEDDMTQYAVLIRLDWSRRQELGDAIGNKRQAADACQPAG